MIRSNTRARMLSALLALGIGIAACDSVTEPTTPIGEYTLLSVNGDNVPSTMFEDLTFRLEVTGGTLEMDVDSTYIATIITKETVDVVISEYVDTLQGRWTQDVVTGTITFTLTDDNTTFTGSWAGRNITALITSGLQTSSLVFQKPR